MPPPPLTEEKAAKINDRRAVLSCRFVSHYGVIEDPRWDRSRYHYRSTQPHRLEHGRRVAAPSRPVLQTLAMGLEFGLLDGQFAAVLFVSGLVERLSLERLVFACLSSR